jgi:ribosomal protein S3
MADIMSAGARGVEILISGKVPSSRAKTWRFYMGYLKKSGDIAVSGVNTAYASAKLKTGIIGVQVRIMPSTTKLPDDIEPNTDAAPKVQDVTTGKTEALEEKPKKKAKKSDETKKPRKKPAKKEDAKKDDAKDIKKNDVKDAKKDDAKKDPEKKDTEKKAEA